MPQYEIVNLLFKAMPSKTMQKQYTYSYRREGRLYVSGVRCYCGSECYFLAKNKNCSKQAVGIWRNPHKMLASIFSIENSLLRIKINVKSLMHIQNTKRMLSVRQNQACRKICLSPERLIRNHLHTQHKQKISIYILFKFFLFNSI